MFWPPPPPKFSPLALPKLGPLVKIIAKLILSTLKCEKFSKFFACGRLVGEELMSLMISGCKAEDSDPFP